tara:strand:+ start:521 stop:1534 length:1014 start_codon:yes stop_codon:yes gene_type:complete
MISIPDKKKKLNLGFLGVGWIGRNRMQALLNHSPSKATVICEPDSQNAEEAIQNAPDACCVENAEEMYNDTSLDGIVIATPSALHAEQSIAALNAGKAVFCQKPLGRTADEVKNVVAASKAADKLLTVDLSYRYTKAFQEVYKRLINKDIGEVYAIDLCFHNAYGPDKEWFYDLPRSGGGCVMDLGIHLIDLALWSLGFPEIKEVRSDLYAQGKKLQLFEDKIEDYASISFLTETNININLKCSWHLPAGKDAEIHASFYGTKGGLAFKNVEGSFYDFTAEKYNGTQTEVLVTPPDSWGGRAGVVWADDILNGKGYDATTAEELIKTATLIDRIYAR